MKVIVGVDPDSNAHGIAIYIDGKLVSLHEWQLMDIHCYVLQLGVVDELFFSIENVLANTFIYERNEKDTKRIQSKVGIAVGRCQQAQMELMRLLDYHGVPYQTFKPMRGNWAADKKMFERITGWTGRSNADTRSAAFFGYLMATGNLKEGKQ